MSLLTHISPSTSQRGNRHERLPVMVSLLNSMEDEFDQRVGRIFRRIPEFVLDVEDRFQPRFKKRKLEIFDVEEEPITRAVVTAKDNVFIIKVDVSLFLPDGIKVKMINNKIEVNAKHELKGSDVYELREVRRSFDIPDNVDPDTISARISAIGQLTIEAPLKFSHQNVERTIVIERETTEPIQNQIFSEEETMDTESETLPIEKIVGITKENTMEMESTTEEKTIDIIEVSMKVDITESPTKVDEVGIIEAPTEVDEVGITEAPTKVDEVDIAEAPTKMDEVDITEAPTKVKEEDIIEAPKKVKKVDITKAVKEVNITETSPKEKKDIFGAPSKVQVDTIGMSPKEKKVAATVTPTKEKKVDTTVTPKKERKVDQTVSPMKDENMNTIETPKKKKAMDLESVLKAHADIPSKRKTRSTDTPSKKVGFKRGNA